MSVDQVDNKIKKRILVVHSGGDGLRGSEFQILETIKDLKTYGREVVLVCDQPIMLQAAQKFDIPSVLISCAEFMIDTNYHKLDLWGLLKSNLAIAKLARKNSSQIIYANSGRANQMSCFAAYLTRLPLICHVHCFYYLRYLRLYMVNRADVTIHCSHSIAAHNENKLQSKKSEVVLNGIDFTRIGWDVPDLKERHRKGIPDGSIVIGYLGAIIQPKGIEVLLMAFAVLSKQRENLKLVLGGNGDIGQFSKFAEELGIASHVFFLGHIDKPDLFFRNLVDIHVMPSPVESFGRTVVEAAACGVYTVSADAGGLREAMLEGAFGTFFTPGDSQSLVNAINKMIDTELWMTKNIQLRELAIKNFDINISVTKIMNILDDV